MKTEINALEINLQGFLVSSTEGSLQNIGQDMKQILQAAQKECYKTVNSIMIQAYWLILYAMCRELSWSLLL